MLDRSLKDEGNLNQKFRWTFFLTEECEPMLPRLVSWVGVKY